MIVTTEVSESSFIIESDDITMVCKWDGWIHIYSYDAEQIHVSDGGKNLSLMLETARALAEVQGFEWGTEDE